MDEVKTQHFSCPSCSCRPRQHFCLRFLWLIPLSESWACWLALPLLLITLRVLLSLCGWFIFVCGGTETASQVSGISAAHLSSAVSPVPRCAPGTSGVGRPACQLASWLGFVLTVTELSTDWICVKWSSRFQQISAVIFVCPDGFHSVSSYHVLHDWMWLKTSIHITKLNRRADSMTAGLLLSAGQQLRECFQEKHSNSPN